MIQGSWCMSSKERTQSQSIEILQSKFPPFSFFYSIFQISFFQSFNFLFFSFLWLQGWQSPKVASPQPSPIHMPLVECGRVESCLWKVKIKLKESLNVGFGSYLVQLQDLIDGMKVPFHLILSKTKRPPFN